MGAAFCSTEHPFNSKQLTVALLPLPLCFSSVETLSLLHDSIDSLLLCLDLHQSVAVVWPVLRDLTLRLRDSLGGSSDQKPLIVEENTTRIEGVCVCVCVCLMHSTPLTPRHPLTVLITNFVQSPNVWSIVICFFV